MSNNSIGMNYTIPFDVLYPLAPIGGIGSQNEITPAILNQRFSSIRNNEHAILRAMGSLAQSLGGVQFLSEYARGLSDVVYGDSWTYTDTQIRGATFTTDYDPAGNPINFGSAYVKFSATGIGSINDTEAVTYVFAGGLLIPQSEYVLSYVYGSVILYVAGKHVTAGVPIQIVIYRKFNIWDKTVTSHPVTTPPASFDGTTTFFEYTIARSAFGILYSLDHIAITLGNKRLVRDVDYSINTLPNDQLSIRFLIAVTTANTFRFHNTSEYASKTETTATGMVVNVSGKTITLPALTLTDAVVPCTPIKTTDVRMFIRRTGQKAYHIDPKYLSINASTGIITINTANFPSWWTAMASATDLELTWMRTLEPSKYSASYSFPDGTFTASKKTYSIGTEGGNAQILFLNIPTPVFQNGRLLGTGYPDIDYLNSGDMLIINSLTTGFPEASNYNGVSILQNFNVPDGYGSGIADIISEARSAWATANAGNPGLTDVYGNLNMHNNQIYGLKDGTQADHAVNLGQVNTLITNSSNTSIAMIIALG